MKKEYIAPIIEYLAFSTYEVIANDDEEWFDDSFPWNDSELGWT